MPFPHRTHWPALAAAALFAALVWPVTGWLWQEWLHNDYYSHGPLVLIAAALLTWRLWPNHASNPSPADRYGLPLLALTAALYLWASYARAPYLAALGAIALLAALLWSFGGFRLFTRLAFPVLILALTVPLPFVERATLPLALYTGLTSGVLANWLGAGVTITGVAVTLPNTALTIGAQCSGINSMMSLLAVTALAAFLFRGPWWGRLALVAAAIPLAALGNMLRVTSLLVVARQFGSDAAFHFYHDYSGPLFFLLALALLVPLLRVFQCNTLRSDIF
ncbi:MAG: hypothetical protein Kow0031_08280 [Anaerolineae bacterium]